ncbi:MAG: H-X9-DG-CTERM domain-containing protein [Phycisphaerae bacterium]
MTAAHPRLTATFMLTLSLVFAARADAADPLIDLLPDDAIAALHIPRPSRALAPAVLTPLFETLAPDKRTARLWTDAVKRLPGAVLIGAVAPHGRDLADVDVIIVLSLRRPGVSLDDLVDKTLLPAILAAFGVPPDAARLDRGGNATQIYIRPSDRPVFAFAVRDKLAFGSTNPQFVLRWKAGAWPPRRWIDLPGVRRMLARLPAAPSARILFNPLPLVGRIEKPKPNSGLELALKVLAPEDVQAAAADLSWHGAALTVEVNVALADECHGVARILTRPPSMPRSLGVFPPDFLAVARVGFGSGASVVRELYTLTDRFDEAISAEYRMELAEFNKEIGVDFEQGLLGNLVGEMAFGLRVDFTRRNPIGWAAVFPLRDSAAFSGQLDRLIAHFNLTFETSGETDPPVRTATGTYPFAMLVRDGRLIIADTSETIVDITAYAAEAGDDDRPAAPNLRACLAALGQPNQFCAMLDVDQLRRRVPILPMAVGSKLAPLFAKGSIGASWTFEECCARLTVRWAFANASDPKRKEHSRRASDANSTVAADALVTLMRSAVASAGAARRQSQRIISQSNMRTLGMALYVYAEKHHDDFPKSLSDLLRAVPDITSLDRLVSPYDGRGPKSIDDVEKQSYLIYRPGLSTKSDPHEVLLAERDSGDRGGANFLFVDAHVEFIAEPRALELLQAIRASASEVRP